MNSAEPTESDNNPNNSLDPADWSAYRDTAHRLLDACIDRLESARDLPWREPESPALQSEQPLPVSGTDLASLSQQLIDEVMPFATGNTHPRFFGWVHGTGLASGLLAEMVTATMNSNCGGRDHGAVYIERCVINWCCRVFGLPEGAGGILTSGTSLATVLALSAARVKTLGPNVRKQGLRAQPQLVAYAAAGAHHCLEKALAVMGIGSDAMRLIATDGPSGSLDLAALSRELDRDRANGCVPLCVVGTAGSVNTGRYDALDQLADFCQQENIWLHIDGAFGAWSVLADSPWSSLARGIDQADSIACDFHKWMYVQYDAGAVLVRDAEHLRAAFEDRPAYLEGNDVGLAGGSPWFCDQGIELSRGFRALKVWTALKTHGLEEFGRKITDNCEQAALMGRLVEAAEDLELATPVMSNVCCFRITKKAAGTRDIDELHRVITARLQLDGVAALSTTTIDGRTTFRAAIVNHRTCAEDIDLTVASICNQIN